MKSFAVILLVAVLVYFGAVVYLYVTQDEKVFNKKYAKPYVPEVAKKTEFKTKDSVLLEGAYTKNGDNLPLVLYFGGNANNVTEFLDKTASKLKNYNFIGFNYPGYAGSGGRPCEKCILRYALEIFDFYKPDIVMGRSLGTSVAAFTASKRDVKKVVLVTPFDSIVNIAKNKYPFLPVEKLLKYRFEEYKWIAKTDAPVSVLLVKNDDVIPEENVKNLLKSVKNLAALREIDGVTHGEVYKHHNIVKVLDELLAQ